MVICFPLPLTSFVSFSNFQYLPIPILPCQNPNHKDLGIRATNVSLKVVGTAAFRKVLETVEMIFHLLHFGPTVLIQNGCRPFGLGALKGFRDQVAFAISTKDISNKRSWIFEFDRRGQLRSTHEETSVDDSLEVVKSLMKWYCTKFSIALLSVIHLPLTSKSPTILLQFLPTKVVRWKNFILCSPSRLATLDAAKVLFFFFFYSPPVWFIYIIDFI